MATDALRGCAFEHPTGVAAFAIQAQVGAIEGKAGGEVIEIDSRCGTGAIADNDQ